ncbi:MAG: DUF2157 domain-containing protein [Myxococcota bacterium]
MSRPVPGARRVSTDPLDRPASFAGLRRLRARGLVAPADLPAAVRHVGAPPSPAAWAAFGDRLLLFLGAALILAGVIYFFAFNWDGMGRFAQLALLEGAIAVVALVGALRLDRPVGQALLLAATVLVGPLLGLVGTTYQTGADPYGLFVAWAALTLPWTVLARLPALWLVQVVLWNVSIGLYWVEVVEPDSAMVATLCVHLLALVNGGAWLAWELGRAFLPWMRPRWLPRTLAAAALTPAVATTVTFLLVSPSDEELGVGPGIPILLALLAGAWVFGRVRVLDRGLLALAALAVLVCSSTVLGRAAFEIVEGADLELLTVLVSLAVGLVVAGKVALAAHWIRHVAGEEAP